MDADDAADLLAELPPTERALLLDLMEPEESAPVRALMQYRPNTAGAVMTSEPVILTPDATVADALARIREPHLSPALAAQVFVAGRRSTRRPAATWARCTSSGCCASRPATCSAGCWSSDIDPLSPSLPLADITRRMATYNLVAIAVVDPTTGWSAR